MAGHFARLICAVALLMQVLLPAGLMPVRASDQAGFSIVICTGNGPLSVRLDADGKRIPDDGNEEVGEPCDFASNGRLVLVNDEPVSLAIPATYADVGRASRREAVCKTAWVSQAFVRGPPAALI